MSNLDAKIAYNPEPTDVQRAIWRRHHRKGTSPGNPKWYRQPSMPAAPKPWVGQKPKYPVIARPEPSCPRKIEPLAAAKAAGDDVRAYVKAFDAASGFKDAYGNRA